MKTIVNVRHLVIPPAYVEFHHRASFSFEVSIMGFLPYKPSALKDRLVQNLLPPAYLLKTPGFDLCLNIAI